MVGALSVLFVGYSETLAAGRLVSRKHGYEIDPDQELVAQGMANGAAGLVGGFVNDGSLSKSSVADVAGQRTQMASLINAAMVLMTLLFLAGLFEDLPGAALGAVVIDAMVGLITLADGRRYYRVNRPDWVFFMGARARDPLLRDHPGDRDRRRAVAAAAGRSRLGPGIRPLGTRPGSDAYLDLTRHEGLETTPGVIVVRIEGPLFFANANRFRDAVRELVGDAAEPVRAVVIDAEAISQTDTDGADILTELAPSWARRGSTLPWRGSSRRSANCGGAPARSRRCGRRSSTRPARRSEAVSRGPARD